jgi:uncharacterized membrane protein
VSETLPQKPRFSRRDAAEIALGAAAMAFPVATAEEIWNLGMSLSSPRVLLLALASNLVLALLIYSLHEARHSPERGLPLLYRVLATYGLTLLISALILASIDKLELFASPWVALKRTILVAFPASFAATVVDGFSKS